jgi:hypothetical protein
MKRLVALAAVCVLVGLVAGRADDTKPAAAPARKVQYSRDVLPILSAACFGCHGPDAQARKAGLRLDLPDSARQVLASGDRAVVPGDVQASQLVARIFATEHGRMPPAKAARQLKDTEKELLKRWIAAGAEYQQHWAFVTPKSPPLPAIRNPKSPIRNPIDRFVLARLEAEGLALSPEADRYTLARRAALDLTGLPPALEAVDRFVNDPRPDAYERFVDELLEAPAYGERWAQVWLDLARYADSNGFANDALRTIWPYRDWVIRALNRNLPFDQFTLEQLAGDLLPNPTQDQLIATGFHRNTLTNDEGGTDDEEFRVAAVVDRVNTTMQVWMGLTLNCCQCHNHKYDPFSQEEYYRLFAIFNQTEDSDKADNSPLLTLSAAATAEKKRKLEAEAAAVQKRLDTSTPELQQAQAAWERTVKPQTLPANVRALLAVEWSKRTPVQQAELAKYYRSIAPELKADREKAAALKKQIAAIPVLTTPIMKELPEGRRRKTHILVRGNFLVKDREVSPGTPAVLPPLPPGQPANRLALARWLVDRANPLTARVAVNRYWEQLFGRGLVETPEDWGIRGQMPSHPELLDWLAVEFSRTWDVKALLKVMVTSATYRQSSRVTPELLERDPANRLYARGPRFRSPAEVIRDQSLAAAGLLSPKLYGEPVRPPRPKLGLNAAFGGATDWEPSPGDDKYRRALYTLWRRTTPYPSMVTFDAPSRNVCTVNRPRTNTPLQALVTLNDPVYVEAAQALARRMVRDGGPSTEARATYGFRLCLTRPPRDVELRRLVDLFEKARAEYTKNRRAAEQMATLPLGPLPPGADPAELAAWTVVGNVLLNLDEVLSKR